MNNHQQKILMAARGAAISVSVYLILSILKLVFAQIFHSSSLQADGLNNLSDIIASLSVFIGINIAKKPADNNHHFGHSKFETIASFITSVLMFYIGIDVLSTSFQRLINRDFPVTDKKAMYVSIFSMIVLWFTSQYIANLSKKTNSLGLKATATDMKNDFLISFGTLLGTIFAQFGLPIMDTLISLIVAVIIIISGYDIFKESTFVLSDGFDLEEIEKYRATILKHPKVHEVSNLRARLNGNKIYVDVTIKIDGNLSVIESHHITEEIETILSYNFQVEDCDVHVEPYFEPKKA